MRQCWPMAGRSVRFADIGLHCASPAQVDMDGAKAEDLRKELAAARMDADALRAQMSGLRSHGRALEAQLASARSGTSLQDIQRVAGADRKLVRVTCCGGCLPRKHESMQPSC